MTRVLVTGGCGYIGDCAVDWLLKNNHEVTILDNLMYGNSYMRFHHNLTFICGDITDKLLMLELIKKNDSVLHLAAIVGDGACSANPEVTIRVNQNATKNIAAFCKSLNKRMVFASTCSVYGKNRVLLNEDSPTNPLSLYAGTKLEAEKFVKQVPQHYIFRLGTLFGLSTEHARLRCDLVANILTYKACLGQNITVFGGEQYRPLLHVRDAGELMAMCSTRPPGVGDAGGFGTYILSRNNKTILELAQFIVSVCDLPLDTIEVTEMPFEDQRNYKVSGDRKGKFWLTRFPLFAGIFEMAQVIREGRIADVWDVRYHNAKYIGEKYG